MDVLASRLGMVHAADNTLKIELSRYSLKAQGVLGRRCSPAIGNRIHSARKRNRN
ncbi:alpha/beta hydrolase [Serratia symbiotica]|nr:alpha/beta hydrolase [Serratia symbiotica]USS96831.1 alpha/beta hydrolase [Serratia symbiotica]